MWKVLTALFWIAALVTSLAFSLLLGLNVVLVPLWLVNGMAVGIAARRMSSWTCPTCGAEMAEPESVRIARRATRGALVPRTV